MPGAPRDEPRTDLPVLLPLAEASRRQALVERREGTFRLNPTPRHLALLALAFLVTAGAAQAASVPGLIGPFEALFKWIPF